MSGFNSRQEECVTLNAATPSRAKRTARVGAGVGFPEPGKVKSRKEVVVAARER